MLRALATALILLAAPARGCDTALLLAIDVSGSIDSAEYDLQVGGLAEALAEAPVRNALLTGQVALAVVQWSGLREQALVLPWRRMQTPEDIDAFAAATRGLQRAFGASDTAVGAALAFSAAQFAAVPDCRRRVIDISGDGPENAGFTVRRARTEAVAQGIEINAIAIEDFGASTAISAFYRDWVISRDGFVMTARGLRDYPRAIRAKLLRELETPVG
jgi:Ca-activated chloride channel family protein